MWQWTDTDTKLPPRKIHSPFLKINKMELQRSFLSLSPLLYISQFEYTRKTQLWLWRACHSSQGPFRRRAPKLRLSRLSTCMSVKWLIFQLESLPFQFIAPNFHFQSHWLTLALEKNMKRTSKCRRPRAHKMLEAWMGYRLRLIIPSSTLRSIHSPSRLPADIRTTQRTCSEKSCKISGVPDGCILASDVFTDVHSTYFYEIAMSPFRSSDNIPKMSQKVWKHEAKTTDGRSRCQRNFHSAFDESTRRTVKVPRWVQSWSQSPASATLTRHHEVRL